MQTIVLTGLRFHTDGAVLQLATEARLASVVADDPLLRLAHPTLAIAAHRTGDPERARATMHAHMESSRRVLIKGLTEGPSRADAEAAWF